MFQKTRLFQVSQDTISGDFDGNGKQEQIRIEAFKPNSKEKCIEQCKYRVKFSDSKLPAILLGDEVYGGHLINQGDLDGVTGDEFSIVLFGDASEWSVCKVYSYRKSKWIEIVKPFNVYGSHDDYIKKDPKKEGYVIITEFVSEKEKSISPRQKSIKLQK